MMVAQFLHKNLSCDETYTYEIHEPIYILLRHKHRYSNSNESKLLLVSLKNVTNWYDRVIACLEENVSVSVQ